MYKFGASAVLFAEKVMGQKFDITEYGVCFIEDVLDDVPKSALQVSCQCRVCLCIKWLKGSYVFVFVLAASLLKKNE